MSSALATGDLAGVAFVVVAFGVVCGLVGAMGGAAWSARRHRSPRHPRHRKERGEPDAPPLIVAAPTDPLRDLYHPRPR